MSADFADWIGRETRSAGIIHAELVERFHATLDFRLSADGTLPLGIHWCVGLDAVATSVLGEDGHPPRGGFLPPIPLPRRMWASGSMDVAAPLRLGQRIERLSRIQNVVQKQGSTGLLYFVTLRHQIRADDELAITERQDIVYREAAAQTSAQLLDLGGPSAAPDGAVILTPKTPLLFRYCALTFNSHRIHYDLPYARDVEGYPALVVHGPLQATLLAELARQKLGRRLRHFSFRGQSPAFEGHELALVARAGGDGLALESRQFDKVCMSAEAK